MSLQLKFSKEELIELGRAWAAISMAFAIALGGGISGGGSSFLNNLLQNFLLAALTVGIAFLLHELAHKFVAQNYGCWAEFRSFDWGLILALILSFTGFIFAAPGAVMISGAVTREENGKISAAGPLTNLILAGLFLLISALPGIGLNPLVSLMIKFGFAINAWLALFNLIPFGPLDGAKVMAWSPQVWVVLIGLSALMVFGF